MGEYELYRLTRSSRFLFGLAGVLLASGLLVAFVLNLLVEPLVGVGADGAVELPGAGG